MLREPLSPELVLVDPELGARARLALPESRAAPPRAPRAASSAAPVGAAAPHAESRPYPLWARLTAALWLLVIGILIGGAAIPHAQDKPRVLPPQDEPQATTCTAPSTPTVPTTGTRFGFP